MAVTLPRNNGQFASCLLVLALLLPITVESFAAAASRSKGSSSSSSTANGKGTGFGAPRDAWKIHTPDTSVETQRLVDFLQRQKAAISNTDIGLDPVTGQQGLYATKNFKEGQIICKIPSDCALALSDPALGGKDAPTTAHGGLSFLNMYWKNTEQRKMWAPYLDTLPAKVTPESATPDFFSSDELALLEFPRVLARAKQRQEEIQAVAATVDQNEMSLEEIQFATWIVSTRAFPIQIAVPDNQDEQDSATANAGDIQLDDRGQVISKAERSWIRVMAPYIDIVNHNSNANAKMTLIDPEKDDAWFALEATRPIPQGREINIGFGSGYDSSVELLLNYGIVPTEENKVDAFMLRKGGDDCIASLDGWSTTLEEDEAMLEMMAEDDDDVNLRKILAFRIKMKKAYP
jgi:hypothetical protein